eukprot:CAMPEP_0185616990 /NCGR_PEP_ID=MMETSP0436-20130131/41873_1 /TAXON_ID=626734 ORGANISM="Favella taraikaensis, Strain Fe Narragansett Bay" /NCGR_SAMPLE_ID=MMETSP0436 /ASSEMBLY_ACC=CAM_ASM_000390 /LENGTH=32 /DNA_ID= /DNA_START= /DNA_END= /DNA_ORIENTATION=
MTRRDTFATEHARSEVAKVFELIGFGVIASED